MALASTIGCREGRELARDRDGEAPPDDGTGGLSTGTGGVTSGAGGAHAGGSGGKTGDGGAGGAPMGTGGARATGGAPGGTGGVAPPTGAGGVRGTGGSGMGGAPAGVGGMMAGTGGMATGVGGHGTGGMGTGGMGIGGANLLPVAQGLDGKMLVEACVLQTMVSVCSPLPNGTPCPGANATDPALSGAVLSDQTVILGGTAGQSYTITLHIQGVVESKQYPGSVDQNNVLASPRADGLAVGGTPIASDAYSVWLLRVTNPGSTTPTNYYLNSLQPTGISNHTTYGVDYLAQITAQAGATIRMVVGDSNCSLIKNCGPIVNDGSSCPGPITLANIEPTAATLNSTFDFTTAYTGQWLVMTLKGVTLLSGP